MKTITFSTRKHALLVFEAEAASFSPDGDGLVLQAQGKIIRQDAEKTEEMLGHPAYPLLMRVEESGEELMNAAFTASFLALEPDMLAVRLLAA